MAESLSGLESGLDLRSPDWSTSPTGKFPILFSFSLITLSLPADWAPSQIKPSEFTSHFGGRGGGVRLGNRGTCFTSSRDVVAHCILEFQGGVSSGEAANPFGFRLGDNSRGRLHSTGRFTCPLQRLLSQTVLGHLRLPVSQPRFEVGCKCFHPGLARIRTGGVPGSSFRLRIGRLLEIGSFF